MRYRIVAVGVAFALALALVGCSAITDQINLRQALQNEGYSSVGINVDAANNDVSVSVTESTPPSPGTDEESVARIVWAQLHERFDYLNVTVNSSAGPEDKTYSFQEMQQLFGVRPSAYDRTSVHDAITNVGESVILGILGFLVLGGVITLVIVFSVRRSRRKSRMQYEGYPGYPPSGQWTPGQWPPVNQPGPYGQSQPGLSWPQSPPPGPQPPPAGPPPFNWPPLPGQPTTPPPAFPPRPEESGPTQNPPPEG